LSDDGRGELVGVRRLGRERDLLEAMFSVATTMFAVVGDAEGRTPPPPLPLPSIRTIRTNATMARKIPMSRTSLFERFNEVSPRVM
jgi:hypothetical protein